MARGPKERSRARTAPLIAAGVLVSSSIGTLCVLLRETAWVSLGGTLLLLSISTLAGVGAIAWWASGSRSGARHPLRPIPGNEDHWRAALADKEAQLRRAQKMELVGTLAGRIAHDFNNLLSVIMGSAGLAAEQLEKDSRPRLDLEEVVRTGERAANLARQLLDLSQRRAPRRELIDLNDVVDGLRGMLASVLGARVVLVVRPAAALWPVCADRGELEQVILNLVVNARDAMPAGGTLEIETANVELAAGEAQSGADPRRGPHVMVAVHDTGCGMDDETRARAFEPFFTTKERGKGTGLGLAVAATIVEESSGEIRLESELGNGTTFRVYLPKGQEAAVARAERSVSLDTRGSETILLVEDVAAVRQLARRILERRGYQVLDAADADEALGLAERHPGPIHLLLTDLTMPGMPGDVLADRLCSARPELKVLFMSGQACEDLPQRVTEVVLEKPFTAPSLEQKVREVLDAREQPE